METLSNENYFSYGRDFQENDFVLSNSALSQVNPDEGGSWKRLMAYLRGDDEKKESKALERGSLLHQFAHQPEVFAVEEDNKPSETVCKIMKDVQMSLQERGMQVNANLSEYQDALLLSARNIGYGAANWTSATVINKLMEAGASYFKFLVEAQGKVMTDAKTRTILEGVTSAMKADDFVRGIFLDEVPGIVKEWPILFEYRSIKCKSLLDNTTLDLENKEVHIRDIKTTSQPVSKYYEYKVFDLDLYYYRRVGGAFFSYRTYRQLAFYKLAVSHYLREQGYNLDEFTFYYGILACETIEPFEITYYDIPERDIWVGMKEIDMIFDYIKSRI